MKNNCYNCKYCRYKNTFNSTFKYYCAKQEAQIYNKILECELFKAKFFNRVFNIDETPTCTNPLTTNCIKK